MSAIPGRRFAHEPLYDEQKGRIKVYCRCGAQSKGKFDSPGEAREAHRQHVGLKEKQAQDLLV